MASSLKKYFQIFLQLQKFNLMKKMAYPWSFLLLLATVGVAIILNVLFIKVNFGYIHSLAGWSFYQVLAVTGTALIIDGVMWIFFANLSAFTEYIKEGTLDGLLLKPIDGQFFLSFSHGDFEDAVRIIIGLILIFLAMKNTIGFDLVHVLLFVLTFFNGVIILYSFNFIVRCFTFWIVDGSSLWFLTEKINTNAQYPTDIYSQKIVRGIFTFVIPLAFVATVPAKMLTWAVVDWQFFGLSFVVAVGFFALARWFWKFSLSHYASASS